MLKRIAAITLSAVMAVSCLPATVSAEVYKDVTFNGLSSYYNGQVHENNSSVEWTEVDNFLTLKNLLEEDTGTISSDQSFIDASGVTAKGIRLTSNIDFLVDKENKELKDKNNHSVITLHGGYKILDLNGCTINVEDGTSDEESCLFYVPENSEFVIAGDEDSKILFDGPEFDHLVYYDENKSVLNLNYQRDIIHNYGSLNISGNPAFECGHSIPLHELLDISSEWLGLRYNNFTNDSDYETAYSRTAYQVILDNLEKASAEQRSTPFIAVNGTAIYTFGGSLVVTGGYFTGRGIRVQKKNDNKNIVEQNYAVRFESVSGKDPYFVCVNGIFFGANGASPINETTKTSQFKIISGLFERLNFPSENYLFNGTFYCDNRTDNTEILSKEREDNYLTAKRGYFPSNTFYTLSGDAVVESNSEGLRDYSKRDDFISTVKRSFSGIAHTDISYYDEETFFNSAHSLLFEDSEHEEVESVTITYDNDEETKINEIGALKFAYGNRGNDLYFSFYLQDGDKTFCPYTYLPKEITVTVLDSDKKTVVLREEMNQDFDYYGSYVFSPYNSLSEASKTKLMNFKASESPKKYYFVYSIKTKAFLNTINAASYDAEYYSDWNANNAASIFTIPAEDAISFSLNKKETSTDTSTETATDISSDTNSDKVSSDVDTDSFISSDNTDNTTDSETNSDITTDSVIDNTDTATESDKDSTDITTDDTDITTGSDTETSSDAAETDSSFADTDTSDDTPSDIDTDSGNLTETDSETTDTSIEDKTSDSDIGSDVSDTDSSSDTDSTDSDTDENTDTEIVEVIVEKVKLGDVDRDEEITSADALLILRDSVGLTEFTEEQIVIGDVDEDKEITSSDALAVLRISVGLSKLNGTVTFTKTKITVKRAAKS